MKFVIFVANCANFPATFPPDDYIFAKFIETIPSVMIYYNLERVILLRGYKNPIAYLKEQGYAYHTIRFMLSNPKTMKFEFIEQLCLTLRCSPNDLLEWVPNKKQMLDTTHPLSKLCRNSDEATLRGAMQSIPIDKVDEALAYLQQLSSEK
jgi:DNA-binding Xre family transcriptional regulator